MFVLMISTTTIGLAQSTQMSVQRIIHPGPPLQTLASVGTTHCAGTPGPNVYLPASTNNVGYQLWQFIPPSSSIAIGAPIFGSGSVVNFGAQNDGTYFCIATDLLTGCSDTMINYVTITSMPIPTVDITASGPLTGCGTVSVTLSTPYETGCTYQWQKNSVNIPFATSTSYAATVTNTTEAYTCVATNSLGCSYSETVVITANPLPAAFAVSTTTPTFCEGGLGGSVDLASSITGINYQLMLGSTAIGTPVAGTNAALHWSGLTNSGTYTVVATDPLTGCSSTMTGSATLNMNPLPDDATIITGPTSVCQGETVSFSTSPILNATSYTWSVPMGATIVSGGGSTMITVEFTSGTSGDVSVYGQNACGGGQPYIFPVTVNTAPTIATSASPATICASNSTTLSVSGSGVSYVWSGGLGSTASVNAAPAGTTTYYVTATGSNGCTATDDITVTVNPLPNVTLALSPTSACQGVYSVTLTGGSPAGGSYIGGCVSGTNTVYPGSLPVNTWGVYYEYTDPGTGCSNTSSTYNFTVNPEPWVDFDPFYPGAVIPLDEPPFIVTTGAPYGGTYSGPGFYQVGSNWWFSAADAGTGTHTATYTYTALSTGCDGEEYRTYTVGAVGIDEVTAAVDAVSIFPNPVSGNTLNLHGINLQELSSLKVVDVMGRILYENTNLSENIQLDVVNFAPGTYIILFMDVDGVSVNRKFVKGN